jgi:trehalose synthase
MPNEQSIAGWEFLRRYVQNANALVFSRPNYAPAWVAPERLRLIPPSIDPLAAKNRMLSDDDCVRVLTRAGLIAMDGAAGSPVLQGAPPPGPQERLIVQVSRWDRLKDMSGTRLTQAPSLGRSSS